MNRLSEIVNGVHGLKLEEIQVRHCNQNVGENAEEFAWDFDESGEEARAQYCKVQHDFRNRSI